MWFIQAVSRELAVDNSLADWLDFDCDSVMDGHCYLADRQVAARMAGLYSNRE